MKMKNFLYGVFILIIIISILAFSRIIALNYDFSTDMTWFIGAVGGICALFVSCILQKYKK